MILVTGATGFLGSEVVKQLAQQGNHVRCTRRSTSKMPAYLQSYQQAIEWVEADLLDIFALENSLDGITQVYNCAAWVSLRQADKEPMIYTNVTGTANLVDLCRQNGIRMVHVSSVAAVGDAKPGELITENHHLDQAAETDGYAISKLESEMEVWRGIAEGLEAVIVNPSIIIGPNAGTEGSGALFEKIRKGLKFYTLGTGGFVDVEDVAKCMILLMNSAVSGERFIVSAENCDYKSLTAKIAGAFGIDPPSTLVQPWIMELAWRLAAFAGAITRSAPSVDKVSAKAASLTKKFDNGKVKKATGLEFKPLNRSIIEVCNALKTA